MLFVIVDKQNIYRYLLLRVLSDQIALSVFGVYVLMDERNVLDAQKIFVSVALINILKTPLSQLPFAMSTTMQASDSQSETLVQWTNDVFYPNQEKTKLVPPQLNLRSKQNIPF